MNDYRLPRAILFDLDGTIIRYRDRREQLTEIVEISRYASRSITTGQIVGALEAEFSKFWTDPAQHKKWTIDMREGRRGIFLRALQGLQADGQGFSEEAIHDLADTFHMRREREMFFFHGARETVSELKRRGVLLALVTNGPRESQRLKIKLYDLEGLFHQIQIEEEFGVGKPEEIVYRNAMQVLGVTPEETWMVGDHLEYDIAAPQRLGIRGVWHDPSAQGVPSSSPVRPARVITSLVELLN